MVLKKGSSWKDVFLKRCLLPLLDGRMPPHTERVASSSNSQCWTTEVNNTPLFVKFYLPRRFSDFMPAVKRSRSEGAWQGGRILEKMGFGTPELIAEGMVKKNMKVVTSFLITRTIRNNCTLYDYIVKLSSANRTEGAIEKKRAFIQSVGRLMGRLHKAGIFHGDLRPLNIIIDPADRGPLFYFIDNERNRYFARGIPYKMRMKNLVQINMFVMPEVTFTDRLRFFHAYTDENPDLRANTKKMIRELFLKTRKRLQKKIPGIWEDSQSANKQ